MYCRFRFFVGSVLLTVPAWATAIEVTRPPYSPSPSPVSSSSIVQIIFSLLLVLAAIVLVAWFLRRMNAAQQGTGKRIKLLGGVPIGQRERIVLVEVQDTWLVIGVGPGQIRTLHTLQKQESQGTESSALNPLPDSKFARLLSTFLRHQHIDRKSNVP